MKIALTLIQANPHRDMSKYPLHQDKIDALVESIKDTDFWDNLLARPVANLVDGIENDELVGYLSSLDECDFPVEIAYGHHRLAAAEKAGLTEIDIPVKVIDDETMLKIMANENTKMATGAIETAADKTIDHADWEAAVLDRGLGRRIFRRLTAEEIGAARSG